MIIDSFISQFSLKSQVNSDSASVSQIYNRKTNKPLLLCFCNYSRITTARHGVEHDRMSEGEGGGRLRQIMFADMVFPARSRPQPHFEDCLLSFCQRHSE